MRFILLLTTLLSITSLNAHQHAHHNHKKSAAIQYTKAALDDEIHNLPGAPANLPFRQFAGYLNVDPINDRNLFYWLVESEQDPVNDPISLWSNGGPGCSGIIGFLEEQGPFSPQADGLTLKLNNYAWNKIANMMFIEAPAGVGYSYSNNTNDYNVGDDRTARDNYYAILAFLVKFPHFVKNDFYISSESYGGHYMPTLAKAIVQGNNAGVNPVINFRGFAVGNPYTDPISNGIYGTYPTFWGHSLTSQPTWQAFNQHCIETNDDQCGQWEQQISNEVGNLDPYGLDFPVCLSNRQQQRQQLIDYLAANTATPNPYRVFSTKYKNEKKRRMMDVQDNHPTPSYPYDPCRESYATVFMNRPEVVKAIHANPSITWSACSSTINYSGADSNVYMEPIYQELLNSTAALRIVVFSGDDDSVCATLGSQYWIYNLGLKERTSWTTWTVDGQVAGYVTKFEGMTFVTIHGAGHEVPMFKPVRGFEFWRKFLAGEWTN